MLQMTDAPAPASLLADRRRRTADTIFRGALAFNAALTVFWLATANALICWAFGAWLR